MHFDGSGWMGMHWLWWIFWISVIVSVLALSNAPRRRQRGESSLEILRRRYAAGEIDDKEYAFLVVFKTVDQPLVTVDPNATTNLVR